MKRKPITITRSASFGTLIPITRFLTALMLAGIITLFISKVSAEEPSAGFLFDRFKLTLEEGWRTEAAGPFYYSQETDSNTVWAIPPIFSSTRDPAVEAHEESFLYPLFTHIRYGHEQRGQFCQLIS